MLFIVGNHAEKNNSLRHKKCSRKQKGLGNIIGASAKHSFSITRSINMKELKVSPPMPNKVKQLDGENHQLKDYLVTI